MTKGKKIMRALRALSFWDWIHAGSVAGVAVGSLVALVVQLKFQITRLDRVEAAIVRIEGTLEKVNERLTKTEDLLNLDLSWKYLYQGDPTRQHLAPRYHPETRTLELVPGTTPDSTDVRKP